MTLMFSAPFEPPTLQTLGHALLVGAVAGNPSVTVEKREPKAGWAIATAENALLYGHPIGDGDSYVVQTGVLAQVISARHAPDDEPLPKIAPPVELPRPLFCSFDRELAHTAHATLSTGDITARRLSRALDWYRIVLSNAEALTLDVRVGAARSALESLTGAGDETRHLVRSYGRLMRESETPTATYNKVFWAKGTVQLTPDEWWITRLCELRNAIVHGDEISPELWEHEGHHHLNLIHDKLITSLRIHLAVTARDDLLRLVQSDRAFLRVGKELAERLRQAADDRSQ